MSYVSGKCHQAESCRYLMFSRTYHEFAIQIDRSMVVVANANRVHHLPTAKRMLHAIHWHIHLLTRSLIRLRERVPGSQVHRINEHGAIEQLIHSLTSLHCATSARYMNVPPLGAGCHIANIAALFTDSRSLSNRSFESY